MATPPPLFLSQEYDPAIHGPQSMDPGPKGEDSPDPELPSDSLGPMSFFEAIGPVKEHIWWLGKKVPVQFTLLDVWEERELTKDISAIPGPEGLIAERQLRMARSLYSVNTQRVFFSNDPVEEANEREGWAACFPGPLLFELSKAYERAANQPIAELLELQSDPK